jgi:hypothetical protein
MPVVHGSCISRLQHSSNPNQIKNIIKQPSLSRDIQDFFCGCQRMVYSNARKAICLVQSLHSVDSHRWVHLDRYAAPEAYNFLHGFRGVTMHRKAAAKCVVYFYGMYRFDKVLNRIANLMSGSTRMHGSHSAPIPHASRKVFYERCFLS